MFNMVIMDGLFSLFNTRVTEMTFLAQKSITYIRDNWYKGLDETGSCGHTALLLHAQGFHSFVVNSCVSNFRVSCVCMHACLSTS